MGFILSDASFESHKFLDGPYWRVPKEIGCAFTASLLVSPLVSIIDKAMVEEITGIRSLMNSMKSASLEMCTKPKQFLGGLSFRLTFLVYFGTYAVANLSEAALDYKQERKEKTRKMYKVSCASAANVGLLAWRDSVFAREFSGGVTPTTTPVRTIALFAVRDSATMAATFYVAPKVSKHLVEDYGWNKNKADVTAALSIPALSQFLTAPVHIHALDYYARPNASVAEQMAQIKNEMFKVCFARGLRVLPAFGIGSFSNNKFREMTIKQLGGPLTIQERMTSRMTDMGAVIRRQTTSIVSAITPKGKD